MNPARLHTFGGRTQTLKLWAQELGVTVPTLKYRLRKKFPPEKVFAPAFASIRTQWPPGEEPELLAVLGLIDGEEYMALYERAGNR